MRKATVIGNPDLEQVCTSYVKPHNPTMRMQMRRFTWLTNAFSKKCENHMHMVAFYTVWHTLDSDSKTLRVTPAMVSGLTDRPWSIEDLAALIDSCGAEAG